MPTAVGQLAHDAAQRIDLSDQVPFRNSADRRVARHLRDKINIHGDHRGSQTEPGASSRRLATGMTGADNDDIILLPWGWGSRRSGAVTKVGM